MSEKDVKTDDEDAFHDALNSTNTAQPDKPLETLSNEAVEDLLKKQSNMSLQDDKETKNGGEEGATGGASAEQTETAKEDFDEEELRDLEKNMTEEELLRNKEEAEKLKLEANALFKNDEAKTAIEVYTKALMICPTTYTKERAILYGNRAAAKIKVDAQKSAIEDCSIALQLWPEYVRVLLRRAKLYELDDKPDEALEDYKRVYELDPGHNEARAGMLRLPPIINERNERLKTEMMGKLKDLGNMILKPFGLSTSNFQMQQDPNTGSYSINFNQKQ